MRLETAVFRPKYTSPVPADFSCAIALGRDHPAAVDLARLQRVDAGVGVVHEDELHLAGLGPERVVPVVVVPLERDGSRPTSTRRS